MSKNKKHKNISQNNNGMNTDTQDVEILDEDTLETEEDVTECQSELDSDKIEITDEDISNIEILDKESEESITVKNIESSSYDDKVTIVESIAEDIEDVQVQPEIETSKVNNTSVSEKSTNLYKVGSGWAGDKCVNQSFVSPQLSLAIEHCNVLRDEYKKTYYVFDKNGNAVYTSEYTSPKDNYYRVGTEWNNGTCINQKFIGVNFDEACEAANENTKQFGNIYHVFDSTGRIVFSAKKKLILLSYKKRSVNKNADWYTQ